MLSTNGWVILIVLNVQEVFFRNFLKSRCLKFTFKCYKFKYCTLVMQFDLSSFQTKQFELIIINQRFQIQPYSFITQTKQKQTHNKPETEMMSSYIRREAPSFIESNNDSSTLKKRNAAISSLVKASGQQANNLLTVHEFEDAVNMIFRPKKYVRLNRLARKNPQTDRTNVSQEQSIQTDRKQSSLQKSLSLLKKIKDYIIPTKFSFLSFNKNEKSQIIDLSKKAKNEQSNQLHLSLESAYHNDNDFQSNEHNKSKIQSQNDSVSDSSFIIPDLKISSPLRKQSNDGSQSSKISSRPPTNRSKESKTDKNGMKSINKEFFSSKNSQRSERSIKSKTSRITEDLSKINHSNHNLLKSEHVEGQKLKYFHALGHIITATFTSIYTLIGNQNQLDCICLSKNVNQDVIDTDLVWSLGLEKATNEKGNISHIAFDMQKSTLICLLSNDLKLIQIYRYNVKQLSIRPIHISTISFSFPVHSFYLLKQNHMILLYQSKLIEIYSIDVNNQIKKRYQKPLESKVSHKKNIFHPLQILSFGQPFINTITVYMSCDVSESGNSQLFDLYIIEITYLGQGQTTMSKPHKVYSIRKDLKHSLRFDNFSKKFFLLYAGLEILAVMKEGYMIDSAKVDIQEEKSLLKYIGKNRLLLITQTKIEQYEFNLNEKCPPYRLEIRSLDSILLPKTYDPKLYEFLEIAPIFQPINGSKSIYQQVQFISTYLLCFQLKLDQNKKAVTGQVPYILTMTKPVSINQKAEQLFHFEGKDISEVDIRDIEEKVDIAKKMGLKVREIYLDLWNRTKKSSVQDFCFLLDTLDYETISKEIQKKLKKQAMLYTQLSKIESSCFYLLKKLVTSPQCTENDLKNFIVSHFKIKKYYFFKDVARFCQHELVVREQLKKPDKGHTSQLSSKQLKIVEAQDSDKYLFEYSQKQERKLMFDIQAFYTYNQMQLKSYLLNLFHKYFYQISQASSYTTAKATATKRGKDQVVQKSKFPLFWAKKKDYLLKIKIMMNNFRFQFKIIYEELLQELIKLTEKGNMIIELLNDFEEILPKTFQNEICNSVDEHKLQNPHDNLKASKKIQIQKLKTSLSKSTQGELQLQGIWRQVPEAEYANYLFLQNVETIYNKQIVQSLSKDLWFKRNLYSQHDFILKTKDQIMQIDRNLKSSYIFYFFIDRVYEIVKNSSLRKEVIDLIDQNYASVLPKHLKGKVELYYQLFLQTKKLFKQYIQTLHHQARNPTTINAGLRSTVLKQQTTTMVNLFFNLPQTTSIMEQKPAFKKSLYQTFLPPKQTQTTNHLDSFQNFLKLTQIQLFRQFIKLEYILVGCIFHRIKPVYQKFDKGKQFFNQTVEMYFESKTSDISHLKCLLNRLNSQSKEFQASHFELYEVLVKSVMVKTQIGSLVPEKQYVNVEELIIYIRDIFMINQQHLNKKGSLTKSSQILGFNINANQKFVKLNKDESFSESKISQVRFVDDSPRTIQSKGSYETEGNSKISMYFNMLGCISENQELFKNLNIRISLYDIYELHTNNKTENITTLIVEYLIESQKLYELYLYEAFEDKTVEILVQAALILNKLFTSPQNFIKQLNHMQSPFMTESAKYIDNQNYENELFFILLWKIMSNQEFMYNGWILKLLENKDIAKNYVVNEILKENLVIFMAKYRFSLDRLFVNNIRYLECLIQLLPQKNKIRRYFAAQIELVKTIEPTIEPDYSDRSSEYLKPNSIKPMIRNPLTENSEIISIFHIEEIFSLYPSKYLLKLNLEKICSIVNQMQQILLEVAVKQRLADRNIDSEKNVNKKNDISIAQSQEKKDDHFLKLQKQNGNAFIATLEKSFHHLPGLNDNSHTSNPYSGTPMYSPVCETPIAVNNRQIILSELQTLIKQSAQPHTFFKETEAKLIRSFKLLRESRSANNLFNKQRFQSPQRYQQDLEPSATELQNLSEYYTGLAEIYEIVIKRLINCEMIKEVLGHLEKLLNMSHNEGEKTNQLYIVYPLLILSVISRQLSPQNKLLLIKICSHLFKEPIQLLRFIKELVGGKKEISKNLSDSIKSSVKENMFTYSLKELNKKLIDYEKMTRVYKIQYVLSEKCLEKNSGDQIKDQKQQYQVKMLAEKNRKLKKKLTIRVEDDQQQSPVFISQEKLHVHQPKLSSVLSNQHYNQIQYLKRPFSYQNPLIAAHCINSITSEQQKFKFVEHIWKVFESLHKEKQLFIKDFQFMIMNVMLLQEPYTIVKYLETKLKGWYFAGRQQEIYGPSAANSNGPSSMLKFKPILSYFNEMIKQPIINPLRLLEFGKRMFYMLYSTIVERSSIQYQIREYYDIPLTEILSCDQFPQSSPISEFYTSKFRQCIEAFSKKQKQLKKKMSSSGQFLNPNFQISSNAQNIDQKSPLNKRKPSISQASPNKTQNVSKQQQQLLELSYNNIDDSIEDNLEIPFATSKNPSKISQNSKGEENFDPSKERQLVYSRGEKRFSAMLSNNNSSIILKNKLSPKSIRSGKAPSITISGSMNSKIIRRQNQRYFPSKKQKWFSPKKNKKTFDGMIRCRESSDEDISYQQQSVIYEQDFQNSRHVSSNDGNENQAMIAPPKLYDHQELENILDISGQSIQNSKMRNLVAENLNSKKEMRDELRWSQKENPKKRQFKKNSLKDDIQAQPEQLYTPQFRPSKVKGYQTKNIALKSSTQSLQKPNQNLKDYLGSQNPNKNHIIMEQDESALLEHKNDSGCEYVPDNIEISQKIIVEPMNLHKPLCKIESPTNIVEEKPEGQSLMLHLIDPLDKKDNKSSLQNIVSQQNNETYMESPPKRIVTKINDKQSKLSNELIRFSKQVNDQNSAIVKEFNLEKKEGKQKSQKKQNVVKFQRKSQKSQTIIAKAINLPNTSKTLDENVQQKPNMRKVLTLQIPPEQPLEQPKPPKKSCSLQTSNPIPTITISPRNHIPQKPKPHVDTLKQSQLQKKIKHQLTKHKIQMFLLTQLEDVYEKFREYWDKCEDIIVLSNSPRDELGDSNNGYSRNTSIVMKNNSSFGGKSKKESISNLSSHQDISLSLSHSQHSLYQHDHEQIELLSNQETPISSTLFTKQQLYILIITILQQKLKLIEQQELPETEIILQEIKDKLFYDICMKRLVETYTNESNVNTIAKIIDLAFQKKIYLTDYYYEVVSKKEVQMLERIVGQVIEKANMKTVKYNNMIGSSEPSEEEMLRETGKSIVQKNAGRMYQAPKSGTNNASIRSNKSVSPRANSGSNRNTPRRSESTGNPLQKALDAQILKVQTLLQKIPLNILQYRKKQLMLKLKPGLQGGRKYLLEILVRVFQKKKDKKLGEQVYLRLKNILDKDIK